MKLTIGRRSIVAAALAATLAPAAAGAADFYSGKSLNILVGAAAGGGYDLPARVIARHLGRHIPGHPDVVVQNMPGAAGLIMTNHLYNAAAQDGTVIGMPTNSVPFEPMLRLLSADAKNVHFDALKLQWIGTPTQETYVAFVWHAVPVHSAQDLKKAPILMGSTGVSGTNSVLPMLTNGLLGTRMRVVTGYKGQSGIFVALERGEVQGNVTGLTNLTVNKADWMQDRKVRILIQYALRKDRHIPDVPLILDLIKNKDDRAAMRFMVSKFRMARPLTAPPGVPSDRVDVLRQAFDATMADKRFLNDAGKLGLDINPMTGKEITALVKDMYQTPKPVIERARNIVLAGRKQMTKRAK